MSDGAANRNGKKEWCARQVEVSPKGIATERPCPMMHTESAFADNADELMCG